MANCLQFNKEIQMNPGNSGASKTRAMVCELLAIKLLKEFSTRELIDALSYDFYPLQGLPTSSGNPASNWDQAPKAKSQPRAARISALEIAIRAQSKRFLSHPLVVQQLEAVWAGTIVFHSASDNLHRPPVKVTPNQNRGYGALGKRVPILQAASEELHPAKQRDHLSPTEFAVRRTVTLYDPKEASVFKLSRLRVPRYRQFLSTLSFAILLGLYLAVLVQKSLYITPLEVVFWFWSAGFMLDEVVGFNEQGFSLYIMSFWNTFDVGILFLLVCYYCMRLYGILMPEGGKHYVSNVAYDLLATNAVLLFPRLFSVLDHYRYFSQLLIAFRMMAMDLVAVFILIVITCSGFFVAFTLSFGSDDQDGGAVAYALFQMLMGYTPAAWDVWGQYTILGKAILTLFLFICHFLIVTILITVLTNSFMAIVQNANEEHQFVFAVNTISMVKSDSLFSYIAPTNIIQWLLTPLRYVVPFRQFVKVNRTVIKVTHFPVLFIIYAYERLILRRTVYESTDLIEHRGRSGPEVRAFEAPGAGLNVFSPKHSRLREPSVATFQKDRALEEVFRRPFRDETIRNTQKSQERRKTSNVVNNWMQSMGPNGTASPPVEQDRAVVDRLEARRLAHRRSQLMLRRRQGQGRDFTEATMSVVSDPEEFVTTSGHPRQTLHVRQDSDLPTTSMDGPSHHTDADGDDELITNEEHESLASSRPMETPANTVRRKPSNQSPDYFSRTPISKPRIPHFSAPKHSPSKPIAAIRTANPPRAPRFPHSRNPSTTTSLYDPPRPPSSTSSPSRKAITARNSARNTGTATPASNGRRTPKHSRARPIIPLRTAFQSAPDLAGMLALNNQAVGGGFVGAIPNSFQTQMAFASRITRGKEEDGNRMSKLVLARMKTLEEGMKDMVREVRWSRREGSGTEARGGRGKVRRGKRKGGGRGGEGEWVDEVDLAGEGEGRRGSSL